MRQCLCLQTEGLELSAESHLRRIEPSQSFCFPLVHLRAQGEPQRRSAPHALQVPETHRDVLSVPLQAVTVRDSAVNSTPDVQQNGVKKLDEEKIKRITKRPPSVVFLNDKLKAKMVKVEIGLSDRGYIEIKSGLDEKTEVISGSFQAVSRELKDGSPIKIDTLGKSKWKKD